MNRIILAIAIVITVSSLSFSQESSFYDAPFGGGGGYVGGWIIPKMDGINAQLKNFGVPNLPSSGFYTSGGAGFIYLGIVKNLRIGGMGFGGSRSSSGILIAPGDPKNFTIYREAIYRMNGGALTVEYTLPFIKNIAVSVGALLGRGSFEVDLYSNSGNTDWKYYWQNANIFNPLSFSTTIKNNYWIFSPTLNVDIPLYRLIDFRIGMGYQFTFGSNWTYDNNKDIYNAPSNINGNSFFIQTGLFIGLFSF